MSLSLGAVEQAIKAISYKPGWKIELDVRGGWHPIALRLEMSVPDRDNPRRIIPITSLVPMEDLINNGHFRYEEDITRFVLNEVRKLEGHEMDEWFKVCGQRLHDPHAGEGKR